MPKAKNAKPKSNDKNPAKDRCGTPSYAITPLLPYIPRDWTIWEPAAGEGLLIEAFRLHGYASIVSGDILTGQDYFLDQYVPAEYDVQATNVPFSIKYRWVERACELRKPFALLAPTDFMHAKTGQKLIKRYGIEVLLPDNRIDFKMPNLGWNGNGAQMHCSWFTRGFEIGQMVTFVHIDKPPRRRVKERNGIVRLEAPEYPQEALFA